MDENITKIPRKSADKLLLVVHLLILVGKHQTELTVKLYICGSEKAPKFAGALPKFSETFPLLGSELGKTPGAVKWVIWGSG